jgi:RING finger protein 113A
MSGLFQGKKENLRKKEASSSEEDSEPQLKSIVRDTSNTSSLFGTNSKKKEAWSYTRDNISEDSTKSLKEEYLQIREEIQEKDEEKRKVAKSLTESGKRFRGKQSVIRAQENTKNSIRFDYQPHICKDYKDTGFCGFGDSCIFLHDRGDYKMGWELDKEWELKQNQKQPIDLAAVDSKIIDVKELPVLCPICKNAFIKPVVTKCLHYFCESCALKHYKKTPKCFECQEATMGHFRPAKNLS